MSSIGNLINNLDRPTAGSEETAARVLSLCGNVSPKNALFIGDEYFTPTLVKKQTGAEVSACFFEQFRADRAAAMGFPARVEYALRRRVCTAGERRRRRLDL